MAVKKSKNRKSWMYDIRNPERKRIRVSGFPKKSDAEDAVAALRIKWLREAHGLPTRQIGLDGKEYLAITEIYAEAEYFDSLAIDYTTKHHTFNAILIRKFADFLPKNLKVVEINGKHFREFARSEMKRGIAAVSANLYLRKVKAALRRIKSRLELEDWEIPSSTQIEAPKSKRKRLITNEEVVQILEVLENPRRVHHFKTSGYRVYPSTRERFSEVADIIRIGWMTGMRKTEILSLEWKNVRFDWRIIQVKTLKKYNASMRDVPMTDEVYAILQRRLTAVRSSKDWSREEKAMVFPRWLRDKQGQWIRQVLLIVAEETGIKYGRGEIGGLVFHDTRHTAASQMLIGGTDINTAAEILGHNPETLLRNYAHSTISAKRTAVAALSLENKGKSSED